jgi:prepilin-type N-terminal cleavage/methylation domain-containing protein
MKAPGRKTAGFTLLEVMIVVAIMGIMAFIAIPSFQGLIYKYRARTAAREFVGLFMRAKTASVQAPIALGSSPYQLRVDCANDALSVAPTLPGRGKSSFTAASDFPGVNIFALEAHLNAAPTATGAGMTGNVTRTFDRAGSSSQDNVANTRNYTVFFEAPGNNRYRVQVYGTVGAIKVITGW